MRILVVDNQFQSRWKVADWLTAFLESVLVESAASAAEALALIAKRKPDLVLTAHPLPKMDGIALAQEIHSQGDPPLVVVMTDESNPQFESACEAAGADFWLEKRHLQARLLAFLQERFSLRLISQSPIL